jgi:hypothetical protein
VIHCFWCEKAAHGEGRNIPARWHVEYSGFKGYTYSCPDCGPNGPDYGPLIISPEERIASLEGKLKQVEAAERNARTRLGLVFDTCNDQALVDAERLRQIRILASGGSL